MAESTRDKFVRLAEGRVNSLIKTIRLLGNLSNKRNYSYTDKDIEKIFKALETELKHAKDRFRSGSSSDEVTFKLESK